MVDEWLPGDDAEHIASRALDFIERKTAEDTPFLALIWFHTPHTPVVAGNEDRALYPGKPTDGQHWFGCVTAMDRQIGRLRAELERLGIAEDTVLWFCSDNGPSYIHDWNSAGPLRGGKATLWEGGIRVPASLVWPSRFREHRVIDAPVCTTDFYPTLLNIVGIDMPDQPPLDGIDVMPLLAGETAVRPTPIAFQSLSKSGDSSLADSQARQYAVVGSRYKLASFDSGTTWQLYDLVTDVGETTDIASRHPHHVDGLGRPFQQWLESCARSADGLDYAHEAGP
jgi:arylsulfatase A-like enzyme